MTTQTPSRLTRLYRAASFRGPTPGLLAFALVLSLSPAAATAAWPERPITLVVPYAPGGITDLVARRLQPALEEVVDQEVVVFNVSGHSSVGTRRVIDAEPNGYEFLVTETGIMTQEAAEVTDFGYRDLTAVAAAGTICSVIMARRDEGWDDFSDTVAAADEHADPYVAGVTIGGLSHMSILAMGNAADIDVRFAQVGGEADSYAALLGGHIDLSWATPGTANDYTRDDNGELIESAKVEPMAILGPDRFSGLPDTPTAHELGYDAEVCLPNLVFAPRETPSEIVAEMANALEEAYSNPDVQNFLTRLGASELHLQGDELDAFLDQQWDVLAPLAKEASRDQ